MAGMLDDWVQPLLSGSGVVWSGLVWSDKEVKLSEVVSDKELRGEIIGSDLSDSAEDEVFLHTEPLLSHQCTIQSLVPVTVFVCALECEVSLHLFILQHTGRLPRSLRKVAAIYLLHPK